MIQPVSKHTKNSQNSIRKKKKNRLKMVPSVSSVAQSCLPLCDPMHFCTPGFPVHHQLPKPTQTVHRIGDAIQPSYPLPSTSPSAFKLSQHHGLF